MTPVRYELTDDHRVYQLQLLWQYDEARLHGSRHVFVCLRSGGLTQEQLWQRWDDACRDLFASYRPTNWQLRKAVVSDLWPGELTDFEHDYPLDYYGPHAGGSGTPAPATPLLEWITGWPGRAYRGRTYWGPIIEDDTDGTFMGANPRNKIIEYAQMMIQVFPPNPPFILDQADFVVLSRTLDGEPRPVPVVSLITNAKVNTWLRTNRKRSVYESILEYAF